MSELELDQLPIIVCFLVKLWDVTPLLLVLWFKQVTYVHLTCFCFNNYHSMIEIGPLVYDKKMKM